MASAQHAAKNYTFLSWQFDTSFLFINFNPGSHGNRYLPGTVSSRQPLAAIYFMKRDPGLFFILLIVVLFNSCAPKSQTMNELDIYNDLIDSLYSVYYCFDPFFPLSFYKWDKMNKKDSIETIKYYKKSLKRREQFQNRIDTINKIIYIDDTLMEINIIEDSIYFRHQLNNKRDTLFKNFNSFTNKIMKKRYFNIDSLHQKNMIIEIPPIIPRHLHREYGFVDNEFQAGVLSLSRILFNDNGTLGIFYYSYIGGEKCAFGCYVLIFKKDNKWSIYKVIKTWVS